MWQMRVYILAIALSVSGTAGADWRTVDGFRHGPAYTTLKASGPSLCRRYRIVWSGGVARRGPDRISPKPFRTKWQTGKEPFIHCPGDNAFRPVRVSDEPGIR